MKKILTLILMLPSAAVMAETVSDTTFVYGSKQIVVCDADEGTKVSVLDTYGNELRKTSETTFVDGQEVTQVYVTSPFIPNKWNINRKKRFYSHIPWFNYGLATMGGGAMSFGSNDALCLNSTKSWEFAIAPASVAIPFNSQHTFGMSFGVQLAWLKVHLKDDHAMFDENGAITVRPIEYGEGETFKKSYISYNALRFPVYLEYQRMINHSELFATIGCSVEWRSGEHSRYKTSNNTVTPAKDLYLNPIGLNLELQIGYSCLAFYMRTALTPLMKTNHAPKAYPTSMGMALCF